MRNNSSISKSFDRKTAESNTQQTRPTSLGQKSLTRQIWCNTSTRTRGKKGLTFMSPSEPRSMFSRRIWRRRSLCEKSWPQAITEQAVPKPVVHLTQSSFLRCNCKHIHGYPCPVQIQWISHLPPPPSLHLSSQSHRLKCDAALFDGNSPTFRSKLLLLRDINWDVTLCSFVDR